MALKQVPVTVWDPSYTLPNWFGTWLDAHSSDCLSPKTVLKWDMFVGVAAFLAQAVLGMLAKVGTRSRTSVSGCEAFPIVPALYSGRGVACRVVSCVALMFFTSQILAPRTR